MIVATAGHVDHGKTALVKALTGVDTDRLPEEKARGMSIDLGFAYRATPGGNMIGMVDVPGHERFIHTMVAGVAGIHHALLVVAADDGPMPQTREHVAILEVMGVPAASVVVTKIDRAEPARSEDVAGQAAALLEAGGIRVLDSFRVCALTGEGVEVLQRHLDALADQWQPPPAGGGLRFSIDRSFTLDGVGLVVTGILAAGSVRVGDRVETCPGGFRARVRGMRTHDRAADEAQAGDRCALNLVGSDLDPNSVARGHWIVAEAACLPTQRLDARLRSCAGERAVRSGARVHVHLGAKQTTGRLVWIDESMDRADEPARESWAHLALDEPIGALWGDRLLVRDWSANRTLAGGRVIDPFARTGIPRALRIERLKAQAETDADRALAALIEAEIDGVDLERFAAARNLPADRREALFASVPMVQSFVGGRRTAFSADRWERIGEAMVQTVEAHHRAHPETWGPEEAELRRMLEGAAKASALFASRLQQLIESGKIARMGARLHRPGRRPELSARQRTLWETIEPMLVEGGLRPPSIGPLAAAIQSTPVEVANFLGELARRGYLLPVAANRFFLPQAVLSLAHAAQQLSESRERGRFGAAEFRDATGIGRNLSIEVLEYFDRCGLTRRVGEMRQVIKQPEQLFGASSR